MLQSAGVGKQDKNNLLRRVTIEQPWQSLAKCRTVEMSRHAKRTRRALVVAMVLLPMANSNLRTLN